MTTYKESGVNIDAGDEFVRRIKRPVRSTFDRNVVADIGHFGALYRADFKDMRKPVLVSSVDGVGTKLKIAVEMNRFDTIGQDLVNHCVNDILACGARPLFFLDYYATGKLRPDDAVRVVKGFVRACRDNDCALIGGETAEMPGVYAGRDFDIAGTIVGVVGEKDLLTGKHIAAGDALVGLQSSGLHTNGYSLARKVLFNKHRLNDRIAELGCTLGKALLAVHRSYFRPVYPSLRTGFIKGIAHVTGGGIVGNTLRIIPKGLRLRIDWKSWERPALFRMIQHEGDVPESEMRKTFNLGLGMILIVDAKNLDRTMRRLSRNGESPAIVGEVRR